MCRVLNLEKEFSQKFLQKKITADIVCKLTLEDFAQLEIVDRKCLKYGSEFPMTVPETKKYDISKNVLKSLIEEGLLFVK